MDCNYYNMPPQNDKLHPDSIRRAIIEPYSYFADVMSRYGGQGVEQRSPSTVEVGTPPQSPPPISYSAMDYCPPMQKCTASFTLTPRRASGRVSPPSPIAPAKRKVTFKPTATVRMYPKDTSKEEKSKLYYSKSEIGMFNLEVNAICTLREMTDGSLPARTSSRTERDTSETPVIELDDEASDDIDSMRGLELLVFRKRRQNKLLAQKSLLKYQSLLNSRPNVTSERKRAALAAAGAKLNLWSSLLAMETARLDALRAYEGERYAPLDFPTPVAISSPFPFRRKRTRAATLRGQEREEDRIDSQNKRRKTV